LTKQYEIARVEEVRDLPTAQVLDSAVVPQKKSSPHRFYIMLGGMCFSFACGFAWIYGVLYWKRTDPQLPWKILLEEVATTCKASTWDSVAGMRIRAVLDKLKAYPGRKKQAIDSGLADSSSSDYRPYDSNTGHKEEDERNCSKAAS